MMTNNIGATVATLRDALAPYFVPPYPDAVDLDAHFLRLGEAGLLPADRSEPLSVRQVSLALIALGTGLCPAEAPAEARRVGRFKLRCRSKWRPNGGWHEHIIAPPEGRVPSFLEFVEQQIEAVRGALPKASALTFAIGFNEAAVSIPPGRGGGMLIFKPADFERWLDPGLGRGIGGAIIEVVSGLFEPVEREDIDPALTTGLSIALGFEGHSTWH